MIGNRSPNESSSDVLISSLRKLTLSSPASAGNGASKRSARVASKSVWQIAREVVLSQATVSSLLDRLSNHGLILRVRAEGDRRQMLVQLTDLGRERLATSPSPLQEEFLGKFRNLPTWEQHMLIASMQKIAEMMNAENLDASPILAVGEIGQGTVDTANTTPSSG